MLTLPMNNILVSEIIIDQDIKGAKFMFINQAHFEGDKLNEDKIIIKIKSTIDQTKDVEGLLALECWKKDSNDRNDRAEYVLVTKWTTKKEFITWLSREEHVNEHKEMNKQKKQGVSEKPTLKKTILQYEAVNITEL
jgi:heme-degrading monooxygenase HmoA